MIRLFLDTEFNGFGGKLMSIALVPEDPSINEFYKEITMTDQLHPWVKENVVPHFVLNPCTYGEMQSALANYLWAIGDHIQIIADWPEDIKHFCDALVTGPGMMINTFFHIEFHLSLGVTYESAVEHNALHDARAIREAHLKMESKI